MRPALPCHPACPSTPPGQRQHPGLHHQALLQAATDHPRPRRRCRRHCGRCLQRPAAPGSVLGRALLSPRGLLAAAGPAAALMVVLLLYWGLQSHGWTRLSSAHKVPFDILVACSEASGGTRGLAGGEVAAAVQRVPLSCCGRPDGTGRQQHSVQSHRWGEWGAQDAVWLCLAVCCTAC